jgi:hypothetical protein
MHFRIPPDHQKLFVKKDIFDRLEWFKTCFDAFSHTSIPPETFFQKRYFWPSGVVLMHFRKLPYHQKLFFRKDISCCLKWLKTCFDAFADTSRPTETFCQKKYFWPSGVVKNVFWCIFAYFQTTRIFFSKKIFLTVWSG